MAEFRSVDIDFDVHKRIEMARESFAETPNSVLRRLLGLNAGLFAEQVAVAGAARSWSGKGVTLPHGTLVRMQYNGRTHEGQILDGSWAVEGEQYSSPSSAAGGVARTKDGKRTNLDGWIYWCVLLPSEKNWVKLAKLKEEELASSEPAITIKDQEVEVMHSHRSDADLPPESQVMAALEALLVRVNRPVTLPEAYRRVADDFGLSKEQRSRLMENGKDCHWEDRVRFARRKLVDAGIMARGPRGLWSLAKPLPKK